MDSLPYLRPGDLISVVAPAGKVLPGQVMPAIGWLEQRGYRVWAGENLFGSYFQYSGNDQQRLEDLQNALDHPEVKAVIFARGGYGTVRIMDKIDFTRFLDSPRWLVGYSDITLLHAACSGMGVPSLHGAMLRNGVSEDGIPDPGFLAAINVLEGGKPLYNTGQHPLDRPGSSVAAVTGGNLSLLYSTLATPFEPDTNGKILFIEEVGEYLYHTDRMMQSLKLAGKLSGLKGLVVGSFSDVKDNQDPFGKQVEEIISDAVSDYDYPVCFGFPAGHGLHNQPIVFGVNWKLTVEGSGSRFELI